MDSTLYSRSEREPILLSHDQISILFITKIHVTNGHANIATTLSLLNNSYRIPKAKVLVRKIIRNCLICKQFIIQHYKAASMPPLPDSRTEPGLPFEACGIDLTGALHIKNDANITSKVYIVLVCCMKTRGIDLDIVNDLSESQLNLAFQRFCSRRGYPSLVLSDNASNLTALNKVLKDICSKASSKITWQFITSRSPWKGGFYERLIGLVKYVLKRRIGKQLLNRSELLTCIAETTTRCHNKYSHVSGGGSDRILMMLW